jgi:hypothetical protein
MRAAVFHLGDLLSITTDSLLFPSGMDGVYRSIDHVTGVAHSTHQLPRAADIVKPWLLRRYPWLADIEVPAGPGSRDLLGPWPAQVCAEFGEFHEVDAMPQGSYVGRDPVAELAEMLGPDPVIAVTIDSAGTQ